MPAGVLSSVLQSIAYDDQSPAEPRQHNGPVQAEALFWYLYSSSDKPSTVSHAPADISFSLHPPDRTDGLFHSDQPEILPSVLFSTLLPSFSKWHDPLADSLTYKEFALAQLPADAVALPSP